MSEAALHRIPSGKGGDLNSVQVIRFPDTFTDVPSTALSGSPTALWNPSTRRLRLMGGSISVDASCSVAFQDDAANVLWRTPVLQANQQYNFDLGAFGKLASAVGSKLNAVASTGTPNIVGTIYGSLEG